MPSQHLCSSKVICILVTVLTFPHSSQVCWCTNKLWLLIWLNSGIQCGGTFAAKASCVMIIIYLSLFQQFSRCRFTMLLHLGPMRWWGETKSLHISLQGVMIHLKMKSCNINYVMFSLVCGWRTWHSHDATCTHLTYRILSIKCCRIYLRILFFSLMYMYILIDNFFGLVESATLYCD